jgi:hypothetical protein
MPAAFFSNSLIGLNDNGIFIGSDPYFVGGAFLGSEITDSAVLGHFPTLDAASKAELNALLSPYGGWETFFIDVGFTDFVAIDNDNRISGTSSLGAFVLEPVQIPEPGTGMLIVTALALLLLLRERATRRAE